MSDDRKMCCGGKPSSLLLCGELVWRLITKTLLLLLLLVLVLVTFSGCALQLSLEPRLFGSLSPSEKRLATVEAAQLLLDWQVARSVLTTLPCPAGEICDVPPIVLTK